MKPTAILYDLAHFREQRRRESIGEGDAAIERMNAIMRVMAMDLRAIVEAINYPPPPREYQLPSP
jgi:hypothetical protein